MVWGAIILSILLNEGGHKVVVVGSGSADVWRCCGGHGHCNATSLQHVQSLNETPIAQNVNSKTHVHPIGSLRKECNKKKSDRTREVTSWTLGPSLESIKENRTHGIENRE